MDCTERDGGVIFLLSRYPIEDFGVTFVLCFPVPKPTAMP